MTALQASPNETDPFDRLYLRWAEHAIDKRLDPPSRRRWDETVLFFLMSEDPDRKARYRYIESLAADSIGADAYELWQKMPPYTPDLSVPARTIKDLQPYAEANRGHMRRLMESRSLLERYNAIIAEQRDIEAERKVRARKAQSNVLIIGCAGIGFLILMVLTVVLIIALRFTGE